MYGEELLREALIRARELPAGGIMDSVLHDVREFVAGCHPVG